MNRRRRTTRHYRATVARMNNPNVFARLINSRKFVVLIIAIGVVAISVFTGKASYEQFVDFLKWSTVAFAIATGLDGDRPSGGDSNPGTTASPTPTPAPAHG
jgi:hypothetical protein